MDINYSTTKTQASGTVIVNDLNLLSAGVCLDTNFMDSTQCSYDWNIFGVSDGVYYVNVLVSDGTATDFNSTDNNFAIDSTGPSVVAGYNSGWNNSTANITLSCTDSASGCSTIYYRVDANQTNTVIYGDWNIYSSTISFPGDGNYALDFNAIDNAGFWDDTNTIYVLVDQTAPSLTITPDSNQITVDSNYIITYSGTDATSGIQTYFVSLNGVNYSSTSATSYVLTGANTDDVNTLYVKARDNADNNSTVAMVSITFSSDRNDSDVDTVPDLNDTLHGDNGDITAIGFSGDQNIFVGGSLGVGTFSGLNQVLITDVDLNVVVFDHNFSNTDLNLAQITITKTTTSLIIDLGGQLQTDQNKTIYIQDNSFVGLCVKDAEVTSIEDISTTCTDANEYNFTSCLDSNQTQNGIVCTDLGTIIKIENLRYSGVRATLAEENRSGGSSCTPLWNCTTWNTCVDGNQTRTCIKINNCGTTLQGKPTEQQTCIIDAPIQDTCKTMNCNDNDSCTIDSCNKGICSNTVLPDCGTTNKPTDQNKKSDTDSPKDNNQTTWPGEGDIIFEDDAPLLIGGIILFTLIILGIFFIIKRKK